jgi:hypothetical protein
LSLGSNQLAKEISLSKENAKLKNMSDTNSTEYLAQLLKDKKQLAAFPNVFLHVERLLDEGKNKLRYRNLIIKCFKKTNLIVVLKNDSFS